MSPKVLPWPQPWQAPTSVSTPSTADAPARSCGFQGTACSIPASNDARSMACTQQDTVMAEHNRRTPLPQRTVQEATRERRPVITQALLHTGGSWLLPRRATTLVRGAKVHSASSASSLARRLASMASCTRLLSVCNRSYTVSAWLLTLDESRPCSSTERYKRAVVPASQTVCVARMAAWVHHVTYIVHANALARRHLPRTLGNGGGEGLACFC